ncbi:MAG: HRDC domain-containing protein, partial [Burkholderiales bacterium]|nr:HRDC domain-containing protein [Burkholderiales bacterium]
VPAYVVFHDATLVEMAMLKPQTLDELRRVSGVGDTKLTRYGEAFLAALREGA